MNRYPSLSSGTYASVIIRTSIWLKRSKIIAALLLPSWFGNVWSRHSVPLATAARTIVTDAGRGDFAPGRKRSAHGAAPPALRWDVTSSRPRRRALVGAGGARSLQSERVSIGYVSIQGRVLKWVLLSVVVVVCGPYGEGTETCSSVSLNCQRNLITEVAAAS